MKYTIYYASFSLDNYEWITDKCVMDNSDLYEHEQEHERARIIGPITMLHKPRFGTLDSLGSVYCVSLISEQAAKNRVIELLDKLAEANKASHEAV